MPEQIAEAIRGHQDDFLKKHCPPDTDGQVSRVAARFGLVAAAGELATALKIPPWARGGATAAIATRFRAWLDARRGQQPTDHQSCRISQALTARGWSITSYPRFGEPKSALASIRWRWHAGWRKKGCWYEILGTASCKAAIACPALAARCAATSGVRDAWWCGQCLSEIGLLTLPLRAGLPQNWVQQVQRLGRKPANQPFQALAPLLHLPTT